MKRSPKPQRDMTTARRLVRQLDRICREDDGSDSADAAIDLLTQEIDIETADWTPAEMRALRDYAVTIESVSIAT